MFTLNAPVAIIRSDYSVFICPNKFPASVVSNGDKIICDVEIQHDGDKTFLSGKKCDYDYFPERTVVPKALAEERYSNYESIFFGKALLHRFHFYKERTPYSLSVDELKMEFYAGEQ